MMMKKFSVGVVVGVVLAFGVSTYAEDISKLIGKQVDNEYPVMLNGVGLKNKAPSIEGTSYGPVREIAESLGLTVEFKNETVILSNKSTETVPPKNEVSEMEDQLIIDPAISTINVEDKLFFSVDDYITKYGNKTKDGGEIFKVSGGLIWIFEIKNERVITIKENDNRFVQTKDDRMYVSIDMFPGEPGQ